MPGKHRIGFTCGESSEEFRSLVNAARGNVFASPGKVARRLLTERVELLDLGWKPDDPIIAKTVRAIVERPKFRNLVRTLAELDDKQLRQVAREIEVGLSSASGSGKR